MDARKTAVAQLSNRFPSSGPDADLEALGRTWLAARTVSPGPECPITLEPISSNQKKDIFVTRGRVKVAYCRPALKIWLHKNDHMPHSNMCCPETINRLWPRPKRTFDEEDTLYFLLLLAHMPYVSALSVTLFHVSQKGGSYLKATVLVTAAQGCLWGVFFGIRFAIHRLWPVPIDQRFRTITKEDLRLAEGNPFDRKTQYFELNKSFEARSV